MPNEIFDKIKDIYKKHNHEFAAKDSFAKEVKQYFANKFFTTKEGELQLDPEEKAAFDKVLDQAIKKLQNEEQLKSSKVKRATQSIGRFIKDLSTLGLWRLFKAKDAKTQFESLVEHAITVANKAIGARESEKDTDAYEALKTQLESALKEKIKPQGRLERNEDIRDKLIKDIATTCVNKLKKNPMLNPTELFNKHGEIVQFVVDGVEKGANKYLASWSPIASFNKQADLIASKLSDNLISKHVGRS